MNRDADERLIQQGEYRYALNAKVINSSTSGVGALENSLSNSQITTSSDLDFGDNPVCIGSVAHDGLNKIWWFVRSDGGSYIAEYDLDNEVATMVLQDTRAGNENVLNFSKSDYITADVLYDNDNNIIMLFFTDGINNPRKINVDEAKLYGAAFTEDMITVIKKPPLFPPSLTLTTTPSAKENNIKEKFVSFAYRWEYKSGEYSVLSPFSEVAFDPFNFNFDYSIQSNESMLNQYNKVQVGVETGPSEVVSIDVVFKIYGDTTLYLIDSFDKSKKDIADNTDYTVNFDNSKIYKLLDPRELNRYYDNVPLTARTQALVDNRIMYGNYTENFDLKDANGDVINVDFTPDLQEGTTPSTGNAYRTLKTNRDYELGIVYLDDFGRSTTILTSDNNSIYVDPSFSKKQTNLNVSINNLPPKFATKYRFFVKQTKQDYYNILPAVFRKDNDTGFVYVLLNATDINKVKEDDFIVVKSDTSGAKDTLVETKVLEVSQKDLNFLEDENYPQAGDPPIAQPSGTYMKIKPVGFRMSIDDYDVYENDDYDDSSNGRDNPLNGYGSLPAKSTGPFYYGTTSSLNDIIIAGTYTGSAYARLTITVDGVTAGPSTIDTFTWSVDYLDDGTTNGESATGVLMSSGTPIALGTTGLTVDFGANIGHDTNDRWASTLKPASPSYPRSSKAYATFKGLPVEEEAIRAGTIINLEYDEYNESTQFWTYEFTSNGNYPNIEEWYFESNAKAVFDTEFGEGRVFFERGIYGSSSTNLESTRANTEPLHLVIRSTGTQNNDVDARVKVNSKTRIVKRATTDELCFETKPVEDTTELYYEIPVTYTISQGYHQGLSGDTNQVAGNRAIINLPYFNAWGFANTVESNSIRDLFNSPRYKLDTKPLTNLKEYKKSFRTTSVTWSGVYEQSTQFNALNDFSLADLNYKDLDDEYGDLNKLVPRGSDVIAFQENRVSRVLVNKTILFNSDGSGNVGKSTDILGTVVPYAGEFGVSKHPFSVTLWGGRIYFVDERRGAVCRLSQDGIEQISDFGMVDYFRDRLKGQDPYRVLGGYDPHDREYVISLQGSYTEWRPDTLSCELIYDDDAPPTSTTSTSSTSSTTTSSTTAPPTTSSTTFFF